MPHRWMLLLSLLLLATMTGCGQPEELPYVELSSSGPAEVQRPGQPARLPLRVAVAAVISPKATLDAYGPLQEYLSQRLDRPVELIQRGTYAEINDLVRSGAVDVAFVCGGAFVEGERDFGMQLLVAPQVNGKTEYYAYVIVSSQSPYISLDELRGKTFAFSDPLSNSGHLALLWVLQQRGETAETFFQKTIFTYSHDNSIQAVVDGLVDGAVVDSLVYDALVAHDPALAARTRIIQRIGPFGIPPVVVHPNIDPDLKQALLDALLTMHQDPQGQRALVDLHIDRFVQIDSSAYDSIRQMASSLRGWNEAP